MIINKTAATVRAWAKKAGLDKAIVIRTGRPAERVEHEYVQEWLDNLSR